MRTPEEITASLSNEKATGKAIRRDALEILKGMIQKDWHASNQGTEDFYLVERAVKMAQRLTDLT